VIFDPDNMRVVALFLGDFL